LCSSPTWRASPRWAGELGYDRVQLDRLNRKAIALLEEIRDEQEAGGPPIVISGCVGPQDDGYNPAELLTAEPPRSTTRPRSGPSPTPRPTWSPRSR
jgi:S-methylmethionine-dependent homocysteine/selenocysteine methylase